MLRRCAEIAKRIPSFELSSVVVKAHRDGLHSNIQTWCERQGIRCLTYSHKSLLPEDHIVAGRPDILFSVYNMDILREGLLQAAGLAINFHDGPLPQYAGFNAPSWALFNGEREHGITWHVMTPTVDGGPIVAERRFTIEPSWSAFELSAKCIKEGCSSFQQLLELFAMGKLLFKAQDALPTRYFKKSNLPFGGAFPFSESLEILGRLQRATSYFPAENPFCVPRVVVNGTTLGLIRFGIMVQTVSAAPGTVVGLGASGIEFAIAGGIVRTDLVQSQDGKSWQAREFALAMGIKVGDSARTLT
jgi:methionyl-tRNA formyltransferase